MNITVRRVHIIRDERPKWSSKTLESGKAGQSELASRVYSNGGGSGGYYWPLPAAERQPSGKRDDDDGTKRGRRRIRSETGGELRDGRVLRIRRDRVRAR